MDDHRQDVSLFLTSNAEIGELQRYIQSVYNYLTVEFMVNEKELLSETFGDSLGVLLLENDTELSTLQTFEEKLQQLASAHRSSCCQESLLDKRVILIMYNITRK